MLRKQDQGQQRVTLFDSAQNFPHHIAAIKLIRALPSSSPFLCVFFVRRLFCCKNACQLFSAFPPNNTTKKTFTHPLSCDTNSHSSPRSSSGRRRHLRACSSLFIVISITSITANQSCPLTALAISNNRPVVSEESHCVDRTY